MSDQSSDLPKVDRSKMKVARPPLTEIVRIGDGEHELKYEPRCNVCKKGHDFVSMVNRLLATGASYASVLRTIEPWNEQFADGEKISYDSIRTHQKRHMPWDSYAVREILEQRAEKNGLDFIEGKQNLVNAATYAEAMMTKGFQNLMDPTTYVRPSEGLAAAQVYHSIIQDEENNLDAAQALQNLSKIIEAVKKVCSDDQIDKILRIIEGDTSAEAEIVEVDVVDDFDDEDDYDPVEDDDDED